MHVICNESKLSSHNIYKFCSLYPNTQPNHNRVSYTTSHVQVTYGTTCKQVTCKICVLDTIPDNNTSFSSHISTTKSHSVLDTQPNHNRVSYTISHVSGTYGTTCKQAICKTCVLDTIPRNFTNSSL